MNWLYRNGKSRDDSFPYRVAFLIPSIFPHIEFSPSNIRTTIRLIPSLSALPSPALFAWPPLLAPPFLSFSSPFFIFFSLSFYFPLSHTANLSTLTLFSISFFFDIIIKNIWSFHHMNGIQWMTIYTVQYSFGGGERREIESGEIEKEREGGMEGKKWIQGWSGVEWSGLEWSGVERDRRNFDVLWKLLVIVSNLFHFCVDQSGNVFFYLISSEFCTHTILGRSKRRVKCSNQAHRFKSHRLSTLLKMHQRRKGTQVRKDPQRNSSADDTTSGQRSTGKRIRCGIGWKIWNFPITSNIVVAFHPRHSIY